jgi:hypothetical protein
MSKRRPSPAMIVAMIALCLGLGGSAIAAGDLTKQDVKKIAKKQAKKQLKANVAGSHVNLADKATTATKADNADKLGGKSAADVIRWAHIDSDGSLVAGSGLTPSGEGGGEYFVTATRSLVDCGVVATNVGSPGQTFALYNLGPGHNPDPNSINLHRLNATGAFTDGALSVVVTC